MLGRHVWILLSIMSMYSRRVVSGNSTTVPVLTRTELVRQLLENGTYDNRVPPNFNDDKPLEVECNIYINSMDSINESSMGQPPTSLSALLNFKDYALSIYLRQHWTDGRLAFQHLSNETLMLDSRLLTRLWVPDLYFSNEKDSHFHNVMVPNTFIRLHSDGRIQYSARVSLILACPMSLHKFPLDSQVCRMNIETYAYSIDKMVFRWLNDNPVEINPDLELAQFQFEGHSSTSFLKNYSTGQFSGLQVLFHLRRDIGFYMIQTYVPSILVVILSWVSFWISSDAVPARISLGVLTVLTMTTQSSGIASSMPKVSYVKAIDVWMSTCLVFVFAALLEFAFVNVMSRKDRRTSRPVRPEDETVPMLTRNNDIPLRSRRNGDSVATTAIHSQQGTNVYVATHGTIRTNVCMCERADWVDHVSRTMFPLCFVLFNLCYWLLYYYWKDTDTSSFHKSSGR